MLIADRRMLQLVVDLARLVSGADRSEFLLLEEPALRLHSGGGSVARPTPVDGTGPVEPFIGRASDYFDDAGTSGSLAVLPVTGPSAEAGWLSATSDSCDGLSDAGEPLHHIVSLIEGLLDRFVEQERLDELSARIHRSEIDLRTTQDRLQESNEELEQFAYLAAHELLAPLRAVGMHAELLASLLSDHTDSSGDLPTDHRDRADLCATRIRAGIQQMDEQLKDLLELSRIQVGSASTQAVDLGAAVNAALSGLATELEDVGASVTVHPLPTVRARFVPMQGVFANLVSNAIRYRDHDRPLEIRIEATARDEGWRISVVDNGTGVDPADRSRLFRLFERASDTTTGNGIGLGLTRRVVEGFDGRVGVDPAPTNGSEFWIWLHPA